MLGETVLNEIRLREKEFTRFENINVFMCTWNLAGQPPQSNYDISPIFSNLNFDTQS
jgi:hypothetical protein